MRPERPHIAMRDSRTPAPIIDLFSKRAFSCRLVLALGLLVWIGCSIGQSAQAQTAHVGATFPVGGGTGAPLGVAVDKNENVFVSAVINNYSGYVDEIVAVNGIVTASSQENSINGNFAKPVALAIDKSGNIFVADTELGKVFEIVAANGKISPTSQITSIGSGFTAPVGVAVDAYGNVFVSDAGKVYEVVAVNGAVSVASQVNPIGSGFTAAAGVAVDSNEDIFVADATNDKVYEIVAVNGAVSGASQVKSIGSGFKEPIGVAVDTHGNVFVTDLGNRKVFDIMAVNGVVSATSQVYSIGTGFSQPSGVTVDASGNVFVADSSFTSIKEIPFKEIISSAVPPFPTTPITTTSAASEIYFTFDTAGTLAFTPYVTLTQGAKNLDFKAAATQDTDACVTGHSYAAGDVCTVSVTFSPAVPGQRLGAVQLVASGGAPIATAYVSGIGTGPMAVFPPGTISTVAGDNTKGYTGDGGAATSAEIYGPDGVAVDGAGNLYLSDGGYNVVRRVDSSGTITTVAGTGQGPYGGDGGPATSAQLYGPENLAVDGAGNLYIADTNNSRIRKVDTTGTITTVAGGGGPNGFGGDGGPATSAQLYSPQGVAVDGAGNIYIADTQNRRVRKVDLSGAITTVAGNGTQGNAGDGGPATSAELYYPADVAVDSVGNIFISDAGNYNVRKVDVAGNITTVASTGLYIPSGIALDGVGNLYIADYTNRIVKLDLSGTITAVAGNGKGGAYSGDGGPATSAGLYDPLSVAVDGRGNLYIADYNNQRVRKVDLADPPSLTFASTAVGATSSDSPQTVALENSGNAPLSFPALSSGQNPSIGPDFTIGNSATCPLISAGGNAGTLAAGITCTLPISFTPQKAGPITEQLMLTDDDLNQVNATQTVTLNGTATGAAAAPVPVLTPASLSFGTVSVNTSSPSQIATLSNTGNAALQIMGFGFFGSNVTSFSQTNNCGSTLGAGASCAINILCNPQSVGALTASLGANFPSPIVQQSVSLTCSGAAAPAPQAALTPAVANFGSVNVGATSSVQAFTLSNAGNAALPISGISVTGANASAFVIGTNACGTSLAAGVSCSISISFTATAPGQETATLAVTDSVGTQSAALTGTGVVVVPQAALTPATANFGSVNVGSTSSAQTFTLTNAGNAVLPITSVGVTGTSASAFVINANMCGTSLTAGASCSISISFTATAPGQETATLAVLDSVGTQSAALMGAGVAVVPPDFTLTGTPGSEMVTRGAPANFTLLLGSADANNPFTQTVTLTATGLPAGATATFSPSSVVPETNKAATSTLTITAPELTTQLDRFQQPRTMLAGVSVTSLLLCFGLCGRRRRSWLLLSLVLFTLAVTTALTGCGSGTGFAPASSTSTITVTGAGGNRVHSTTFTLIVK